MEFDILPPAVSDILLILTVLAGPGGVIALFLTSRQANRKLKVEEVGADVHNRVAEGTLTVDQFNAALPAYKDLLDRAEKDRAEALDKMGEYKDELDEIRGMQERLVNLFNKIVRKHKIQLTSEEIDELETTRPRPISRHHRPRIS